MSFELSRRELLAASLLIGAYEALGCSLPIRAADSSGHDAIEEDLARERIKGLLLGSMIGDAAGGPIEFKKPSEVAELLPNCRNWQDVRKLYRADLEQFGTLLRLHPYERYRPEPEPYGQWRAAAPTGTVTDDTRHKMILINALKEVVEKKHLPMSERDLATAYLQFSNCGAIANRPEYQQLCEESFREYCKSARWVLGNRDLRVAAPPERIWGGVPTCSGQMAMLPLAAIFAGRPIDAYRATYALSFFDTGSAKDINSALVAGLSVALRQTTPTDQRSRRRAWQAITDAMKRTDPYQYAEVPYVPRPTTYWLDFAHEAVVRAQRKPKQLFTILEDGGQVKYFWESHFVLAEVFAIIEFCDYEPLTAMVLVLDFGHDTDSAAQLLGAYIGALYGTAVFPEYLKQPVIKQLADDYDVSTDKWTELLWSLSNQEKFPVVVDLK